MTVISLWINLLEVVGALGKETVGAEVPLTRSKSSKHPHPLQQRTPAGQHKDRYALLLIDNKLTIVSDTQLIPWATDWKSSYWLFSTKVARIESSLHSSNPDSIYITGSCLHEILAPRESSLFTPCSQDNYKAVRSRVSHISPRSAPQLHWTQKQ